MKPLMARDVMNPSVITVQDDWTVRELATFLTEREITGAPVVDTTGRLVGVVSFTDIAENQASEERIDVEASAAQRDVREWESRGNPDEFRGLRVEGDAMLVRDIMTPTVYTIPDSTAVPDIARTMVAGRIHRLFVTRDGRVVGIVTTLDLARLLVEEPA